MRVDRTRGASSVELALYTPILFVVVFTIVQFALSWHANQIASATAREAARVARVNGGGPEALSQAEQHAQQFASQVGGNAFKDIQIDVVPVGTDQVRATVSGRPIEIVGGLVPTVSQTVQGPIEEFRPDL